jgi:hypothetical protein
VDNKDDTRSGNLNRKGVSIINKNVLVFAFFLFLSFVFWYLTSLGKELETDIRYPVKYANIPKNKEIDKDLPSRLNLFIKGPGYSILKFKITGNNAPVIIDFSEVNFRHVQNSKSIDYYLVTSGLVSGFNSQLKSVCKITSIKPDTLFFSLK